ncbi:MAG TPA: amino acid adenylation domain-containing protein, partial [Epulopiscium sp.]|nr:amino acid adenylation domain-containing protein [Candidatus Epulonipiscium sp.]
DYIKAEEETIPQIKKDFTQHFDLLKEVLYRVKVVETQSNTYIFLDFHHIIFDGASLQLLLKEFKEAYKGEHISTETYTYFDYVKDEIAKKERGYFEEAEQYYASTLVSFEGSTEITPDLNGKAEQGKPAKTTFLVDKDKVEDFCKTNGVTPAHLFLGGVAYTLSRFAGTKETHLCTASSGRSNMDIQNTMGMFVETIPLSIHMDKQLSCREYVKHAKDIFLKGVEYEEYPFAVLATKYNFMPNIMYVCQLGILDDQLEIDGKEIMMEALELGFPKFQVEIMIEERQGQVGICLTYNDALYSLELMNIFAEAVGTTIEHIMEQPESLMRSTSMVSHKQAEKLDGFHMSAQVEIGEKIVHRIFEKEVSLYPDKIALLATDGEYTYRELDQMINRVANALIDHGVKAGNKIAILLPRDSRMIVAMYSVFKAGCAYVPCDTQYPKERINYMIEDSQATYIITTSDRIEDISSGKGINIDELIKHQNTASPEIDVKPDDIAGLLYTSGSTGKPKGAMLAHHGISNYIYNHPANPCLYAAVGVCSTVVSISTFSFDMCLKEIIYGLSNGLRLALANEAECTNPILLAQLFDRAKVTFLIATPSRLLEYMQFPEFCQVLKECKVLLTGGEKCTHQLLNKLKSVTKARLYNVYGPTEATIISNAKELTNEDTISIGKPLINYYICILDADENELPPGVVGELCIGGPGVAKGYYNLEERTRESFIQWNGQVIYKSGDYAKWSEDGDVFILGRKDNQVKLRGQRIELEEIETKITQYKGIKNAVVIIKQINNQDHICSYFTSEEKINLEDLKESLKKDLPAYMIPTAFMEIEEMPFTLNGKIDVKELPEVDLSRPHQVEIGASKTLNYLEEDLVKIVSEIVGHEDFGIETDLIKIGFTSLSTIKLAAIITRKFDYTLVVNKMMQGTTILEIENELLRNWMTDQDKPAVKKEKKTLLENQGVALSKTQLGIYYDTMKNPEKLIYNIPVMIKIEDTSNVDKLMKALEVVIKGHPYLQTTLKIEGEEIKQFNHPNSEIKMDYMKAREEEIPEIKIEFPRSFDMTNERLYRIKVVETRQNVYVFLDFHHIIFDGASLQLLMKELQDVYKGEVLAPESYSYFDYVADEISKEKSGYYQEAEEYYASTLADFEGSTEMPADLPGKTEQGKIAETVFLLDKDKIETFCKNNDMTPAHLFLGGAAYTLSRYAGSKDIHLCTISSGRSNLEIQNTMGMFVQTIPLSISIPKDQSCLKYIEEVKHIFLKGLEYEDYPFTEVSTQYAFTPNIMYGCQLGILGDKLELDGREIVMEELDLNFPKFGLSIMIEEREGQIGVCLAYNDALYSLDLMNGFAEAMGTAVMHIMQQPENLISSTSIISQRQAERLTKFRISQQVEIEEKVVHRTFENHVLLNPDKKALVATDGDYTYRELDQMINRVANALLDLGVKVGERVAILLPRDSRMIAAMYGIFKAGCAYIPCDPQYPAERITYMIEDSESSYIITTSDRMSDITSGKAIDIDGLINYPNAADPGVDVKHDDIACLLYTSGSTGNPKGAMLEHHGICNCVYNHPANILLNATVEKCSTVVSIATISFDMCLTEITFALCNGLTLALANEKECTNPVLLSDLFARANGDFLLATPSRLLEYMEFPEFCTALEQCKVIISGGENYTLQLLNKLKSITKARLYNGYGPTEATMVSNAKELTNESIISIGKPLLNYYICILDADENEVPPGVIGELCIGGPGVAKGYYNLEKRTKESFIHWGGQRIYKTGDYAKWSQAGDVFILGRKDNQVKLRGQRIELGEIETKIVQYTGIKSAVVIIGKINNQDHICTYFTSEATINLDDLKASIKQDLPGYMVPTAYMELDEMPFTLNGKIDHKLLPEPFIDSEGNYQAPANEGEKTLCEIYAKVLGLPKVGALDNFFEIGGTSLVVTRVVIEASKYAIEISYGDVFNYPTPRELAGFVSGTGETEEELSASSYQDFSNYNYDQINQVLLANNLEALQQGEKNDLGNILLTGATGFLGIHVLASYLKNHQGKVYCLLRSSGLTDVTKRLKSIIYYYFEGSYEKAFDERVTVVEGDITNPTSFKEIEGLPIDTVINCAANVKHFSQGTDIEDVNVGGVINLIDYCLKKKARLVHVSTASVSGYSIENRPPKDTVMTEQMLYLGQDLDNKYSSSKFSAERHVLENIELGLKAKILRVGNLSARDSDGEFQINFSTNSFMGSLKSYLMIGKFPYAFINQKVEFSPIDTTAESILLLAQTPDHCCVFHNYNNHIITMGDLIQQMNKMGFEIEFSEIDEYEKAFEKAKQDPEKAKILSSMIAYANMGHGREIVPIATDSEYTVQVLYRLGYQWPVTSKSYIERFMNALNGLGYFDLE